MLKRIARSEACLRELFSSDLGDGTELLDPDRADRKLSYCDKSGQVKEIPACKPCPAKKAINFTQISPPHERRMNLGLKWVKNDRGNYPKLPALLNLSFMFNGGMTGNG